ncbi:MAG TPA: ribosome biogenesis factor YjgA [Burkholderiaceae bacterium]|nr:ribosome biogenesis factor YjgA [Burkholderiaceae bacterium]
MRPAIPSAVARDDTAALRPSKTQLKQRMHELQQLGQALTTLPADRLNDLQLPERLREAIDEFKRTRSHEGRRRQLQFIGKLMRGVDAEPLLAAVAAERLGPAVRSLQLHEAERWRVELVNDDEAMARWSRAHPDSDAQRLRALVLSARRDGALPAAQRHGRAWRELFQFVKLTSARS